MCSKRRTDLMLYQLCQPNQQNGDYFHLDYNWNFENIFVKTNLGWL